jgi:hypothetical protein
MISPSNQGIVTARLTAMVNSQHNGWRMEDMWLDR